MLSSPVKWSNPTIILVPSEFFLLATLAVQKTAKHRAGQSSMVGNQKAWMKEEHESTLRNQASLLIAEGFSYPSPTIKVPNPKAEAAMADGPPSDQLTGNL